MKSIVFGLVLGVALMMGLQTFSKENADIALQKFQNIIGFEKVTTPSLTDSSFVVQEVKGVGKLVVQEGYFSDVLSYADTQKYYSDWIAFDKKALVLIKAKALLSYDLRTTDFVFDAENKKVTIIRLPEPELEILPELEYYDIQQDFFNPFSAKDYNTIKGLVDERLRSQILQTDFKDNGADRMVSELHLLLSSMGFKHWEVVLQSQNILP